MPFQIFIDGFYFSYIFWFLVFSHFVYFHLTSWTRRFFLYLLLPVTNYFGIYGSYLSSFLIYFFGFLACVIPVFFLLASIHKITKSYLNFIFLRFFLFLISLMLFEQFFIFYDYSIYFFGSDYRWGTISILLANFFTNKYVVIIFSFIGLIGLLFSTDILSLIKIKFKIPKLSFKKPL